MKRLGRHVAVHCRRQKKPCIIWASAGAGLQRHGRSLSTDTVALTQELGEGSRMLGHIAEYGMQPFSKYSLQELLDLQFRSPEDNLHLLERELHVGIAKIITTFQDLPMGFGSLPPIRNVVQDYVQDLRDLIACPSNKIDEFRSLIQLIFMRHRGMMRQIATGLRLFQADLDDKFQPFADFKAVSCADVGAVVPAISCVEQAMDAFFTIRTTLRLLIAHCIQLNPGAPGGRELSSIHELLVRHPDPSSVRATQLQDVDANSQHIGAICMETRPALVLLEAYQHANYICRRKFGKGAPLIVNGIPAGDYYSEASSVETNFPYVDIHLYFVFLEVLKNALQTSVRKAGPEDSPPPIHASLISGTSLLTENERAVKITDEGEGIRREKVKKVWSYFYTTDVNDPKLKVDPPQSWDGRGLGLPVSRVLARYFGGEIDLHSIPRKGTDVYIYL